MRKNAEINKKIILAEIKDIITGAAFPFMLQLIISASVILFADYSEAVMRVVALVFGELLLIAAYVIFGRQNGLTAFRRAVHSEKISELHEGDAPQRVKAGEYSVWKGFAIGFASVIPFMLLQFVQCVAPNIVTEFLLKYAFGWAAFPFIVIGQAVGELSQWLNFIWIVVPVGVHAAAYVYGAKREEIRQRKAAEMQAAKDKRRR